MRWRENSGVARGGRCARWTRGCDAETREDDLGRGHGRARLMTHPLFSFFADYSCRRRRRAVPPRRYRFDRREIHVRVRSRPSSGRDREGRGARTMRSRRRVVIEESIRWIREEGARGRDARGRRAGAERDGTPKRGREGCGEGIRPIGARVEGEPTAMRRERDARGARARAVFKKSAKRLTTDYALLLFFTTRSFRRCPQGHFGASRCASRGLDATRCDCARDATRRRAADPRHRRRFGELDVFVERRCAHEVRLRAWR